MLTDVQRKWIDHLPDDDTTVILPYDPISNEKFEAVKKRIQDKLGKDIVVLHHGAASFGISGQDEIDVYVPAPEEKFEEMILRLATVFGKPKSVYPYRVRYYVREGGKKADVYLVNESAKDWKDSLIFKKHLETHPVDLERYRILKEESNGLSSREYYRRKIEFINEIVEKANGND
jgi:GrpB-like predicted nucleotidyltransferase (UPF0157 family)